MWVHPFKFYFLLWRCVCRLKIYLIQTPFLTFCKTFPLLDSFCCFTVQLERLKMLPEALLIKLRHFYIIKVMHSKDYCNVFQKYVLL